MKFAFVLFVVSLVNCQIVAASNVTTYDKVAKYLHSELKYVESEIMRVWVTIEALQDEMHQNPYAITDEANRSLADLYFYDCELSNYLGELEVELSRRDDPSGTIFTKDQFELIHFSTRIHKVPRGAIPVPDDHKIAIKKRGL